MLDIRRQYNDDMIPYPLSNNLDGQYVQWIYITHIYIS